MKKLLSTMRIGMALFLAMFSTNLLPVATAYATHSNGNSGHNDNESTVVDQTCDDVTTPGSGGWTTKFDAGYPNTVSYTAPTGYLVDKYCVKAGSSQQGNGPVIVNVVPPSSTVTIDYPNINSISHYVVHLIPIPPTTVTPQAPSISDVCGTNLDTVIPATTTGITYTVSNVGSVYTVIASPASASYVLQAGGGFTLNQNGTATYTATLTNVPCIINQTAVSPVAPTVNDVCGTTNDTFTLPTNSSQITYAKTGNVVTATLVNPSTHDFGAPLNGYVVAADGLTASLTVTFTNTACEDSRKVFVCKYVGTPGLDERLQTGQNPISVSVNAIKDFNGVGSYFNDAQGRSFVLAFDTGQAEPSIDECPGFVKTPVTPVAATIIQPTCENPTGRLIIPSKAGVVYKVNGSVATAGSYTFPAGSTVTVTAEAASNLFVLSEAYSATFTFQAAPTNCILGDNDVCPNIPGSQTTVPAGMIKNQAGNCVAVGGMGAGGQVLGTALPTELPATGGTTMPNPLLSLLAGLLTYLFLYRRNKKMEA